MNWKALGKTALVFMIIPGAMLIGDILDPEQIQILYSIIMIALGFVVGFILYDVFDKEDKR